MLGNFEQCVRFTLLPANDGQPLHTSPGDSGGATAWGVTRATWQRWKQRPVSLAEMQSITRDDVLPLYRAWYWNTIDGDQLPPGVDLMVFDHGVLCGGPEAAVELQAALLVDPDGHIGPLTIAKVQQMSPAAMVGILRNHQERFYRSLRSFEEFGHGWLARVSRRADAALRLIPQPGFPPAPIPIPLS